MLKLNSTAAYMVAAGVWALFAIWMFAAINHFTGFDVKQWYSFPVMLTELVIGFAGIIYCARQDFKRVERGD